MAIRPRKKVTWKAGEIHRGLRPHPLVSTSEVDPVSREFLERHLVVGSLWTAALDMSNTSNYPPDTYKQHELPYLWHASYYQNKAILSGSVGVYTGIVRVEEADRAGRLMQVPRHTFLFGGTRYLVPDLFFVAPVTDETH